MTTSATQSLPATDRFSWRRVGMIARYYFPTLKRPLILFPLLSLAVGGFYLLSIRFQINIIFSGTLSSVLSFLYYWSPIIFNRIESSQLTTTLPCRWTERATFVIIFALLGLPLLVFGPSYVLSELGQYLYFDNYISLIHAWEPMETPVQTDLDFLGILLKVSMSLLPFSVALYVVYRARKSRILKAIMLSVAALIGQSITIGVLIGVLLARDIQSGVARGAVPVEPVPTDMIWKVSLIVGCILGALALMFIVLTIRRFKTTQLS